MLNDEEIIENCIRRNMISPFVTTKQKMGQLSWGMGHFGYDARITGSIKKFHKHRSFQVDPCSEDLSCLDLVPYEEISLASNPILNPGEFCLAFTLERFEIPSNIAMLVKDKSTLARLGLAVQNTVGEPAWRGHLTLEISNHGKLEIMLREGMPIAQMMFFKGNVPSILYSGRYQDQPAGTPALINS